VAIERRTGAAGRLGIGPLTAPALRWGEMYPTGVASAVSVFATAPSKVPFYLTGGLLAGWAVLLGLTGLRYAEFPGTVGRAGW
jgi:hypothetical protein